MISEVWTVRNPWTGFLYGYEKQKWRAEKVRGRLKKRDIHTVVRKEPEDGLYEELTKNQ